MSPLLAEPSSFLDYYTKQDVCVFIAQKTFPTYSKWEKTGKIFSPRFKKISVGVESDRAYYSLADAMRISIILYGSVQMSLIWDMILSRHGLTIDALINENNSNGVMLRADLANALAIIKHELNQGTSNPMPLLDYVKMEAANE